jgi:hypothetical protein
MRDERCERRPLNDRGELRHLSLSYDEASLGFEVWKDGYGPIVLSLKRPVR